MEIGPIRNILLDFHLEHDDTQVFEDKVVSNIRLKTGHSDLKLLLKEDHKHIAKKSIYSAWTDSSSITLTISFLKSSQMSPWKSSINWEIFGNGIWPQTNADVQAFYESMCSDELENCHNVMPIISRCNNSISPYFTTSDDRIVEYGVQCSVFDQKSLYQRVQIFSTIDHGNVLILDGAVNLAEKDTVSYTHTLMNIPQDLHHYEDARVLILGGGDGGLLQEVLSLEQNVQEVIMVELDELVMEACSKHMRSVCGSYLDKDKRSGNNYSIIVGDAIKFMQEKQSLNEEFGIIFGDLTDVPVEPDSMSHVHSVSSPNQETWSFIEKILNLAFSILKPITGKYYTHCNGKSVPLILQKYENLLSSIKVTKQGVNYRLKWTQTESFVPSFMEVWVFYQISLTPT